MTALHIHFCTYMFIFYTATFYLTWFLSFFYGVYPISFFLSWPMHRNSVLQRNVWMTIKECETWSHWNLKQKSQSVLHCQLAFKSKKPLPLAVLRLAWKDANTSVQASSKVSEKKPKQAKLSKLQMLRRKKKNPVAWRTARPNKNKTADGSDFVFARGHSSPWLLGPNVDLSARAPPSTCFPWLHFTIQSH